MGVHRELKRMLEALPPSRRRRASFGRLLVIGAVVLLLLGAAMLLIWIDGSKAQAVRDLPPAERQALYRRTLEDLRTVCAARHANDLDGHCRDQARFILEFPECDDTCRRLARWQLREPTR